MKITKADITKVMRAMGKKGGKRRKETTSAERRRAIAAMGGKAKAANKRGKG